MICSGRRLQSGEKAVKTSKTRKSSSRRRPEVDPAASPFHLTIRRSHIHRLGLFAGEAIPAHRRVIEYRGKRILYEQVLRDHEKHPSDGAHKATYLLCLNSRWVLDGSVRGNGSELINHSCDPNLSTRRFRDHMFFFSRRKIMAGEELTIDYRFHPKAQMIPCHCASAKCRGMINYRPGWGKTRAET